MINYFQTTSYGHLNTPSHFFPEPDGNLILSYQDDYPRSYYQPYSGSNPNGYQGGDNGWERTEREHSLLRRAIEYIADMVPPDLNIDYDNDGYVDNVCFIVNGDNDGWATLLWPHRWALYTEYAAIHGKQVWDFNLQLAGGYFNTAVLCHEMQHTLGYPDLYHYANGGPTPVGNWDIMESNPNPPQQSGGYMKWKYGNWVDEPTTIQPGKYTLNSIGSGLGVVSYKIPSSTIGQFFVLEYRNSADAFENFNYGNVAGMLIYRINTAWSGNAGYDPNAGKYDEVYIFRPNGNSPTQNGSLETAHLGPNGRTTFNATSNPKPFLTNGTMVTNLSITDITVSNNKISFTYNGGTTQFVSVVYQPNGGEGKMKPQMFAENVAQNLSENSFYRDEYVFRGWALTPNGDVVYENSQSVEINEDIVLYAVWAIPTVYYTINAKVLIPIKCATIEPEGEIIVLENTDQPFVIQSEGSCKIEGVQIDDIFIPNEGDPHYMVYTFENVTEDHYIRANINGNSVQENEKANDLFTIHPNPANNYLEITLLDELLAMQGVAAQIYNIQGMLLKTLQLNNQTTQMDISNLAKGMYIVKVLHDAKKLIVK
jgi:M6 family metalloprotease-like protein